MRTISSISRLALGLAAVLGVAAPARADTSAAKPSPEGIEYFEKHVRPILVDACYKCHSATSEKLKGGLYTDTRAGLLRGGRIGPAVVPGDLEKSLLIKAVRWADEDLAMPPKEQLSKEKIAILEQWIKMGAPDPREAAPAAAKGELTVLSMADAKDFWSLKKPVAPAIPQVDGKGWVKNPIDAFVLAKLNEKGIAPAPMADKRALIRRAYFDLTGLPPSAEEVQAFAADASPDAFEKVVDKLLASPAYGQRWARHWLDVARYADTKGYVFQEERRYPYAYTFRDWVVSALNADMPYDQFLVYQIAADRKIAKEPEPDNRNLAAMGFLTLGRRFLNNQADIIDDRIDTLTRGTMGLTVACSRCHDHKFDPIPTADYYSLYGVFASGKEPGPTEQPTLPDTDSPDRAAFNRELAARQAEIDKYKKAAFDKIVTANKAAAPIARYLLIAQDARKAGDNDLAKRADDNKLIRNVLRRWKTWLDQTTGGRDEFFAPWHALAKLSDAEFAAKAPEALKKLKLLKELAPLAESAPKSLAAVAAIYGTALESLLKDDKHPYTKNAAFPLTVAVDDVPTLFNRAERDALTGLNRKREALVATHPGAPARAMVINDLPAPVQPHIFKRGNAASPGAPVPRQFLQVIDGEARKPFADGSGRLELAQKIASKDNPLTARVMVNRVWAQHFGKGIVRTPSDFGVRGERPTNPELLDYLAVQFVKDNWSLKKLHKSIMLSATYRQTSTASADALAKDPDNRLFSRQNRQRLEFEALRDALLAATGQLDPSVGGRPVDLLAQPFTKRRTIYGFIDRQNLPNMFRAFDFASPDQHAPLRFENTVPQQALFMMNSPFVVEQAKALAARTAPQTDADARVRTMYRQALSRDPSLDELALAKAFVTSEAAPEETIAVGPAWQYGYGTYDAKTQRVAKFAKFPHFDGSTWAGSAKRPDKALQFALLTATGGHAGRDADHAVIRRWTAPADGHVTVTGTLAHPALAGDGVRGRIVSSRAGELASLTVHNNSTETKLESVAVKKGDTIDFVVDCRESDNTDSFAWAVTLKMRSIPEQAAGGDDTVEWNSQKDFGGPEKSTATTLKGLTPWEKLAQVLLLTNEFVFVD